MKSRNQLRREATAVTLASVTKDDRPDQEKSVPVLNERNYREWRRRLLAYLYKKGVHMALKEENISPEAVMQQAQQKAFGIILEHLPSGLMERYLDDVNIETPKALLESIEKTKKGVNEQLVRAIMAQITSFAWETSYPEVEYNRYLRLYQEYTGAGGKMGEDEAIYYFIACPNGRYISTCEHIKYSNVQTLDEAYTKLIIKWQEIRHANDIRKKNLPSKTRREKFKDEKGRDKARDRAKALFCAYCKADDHAIADCKKLSKKKQKDKEKANTALTSEKAEEKASEPAVGLTALYVTQHTQTTSTSNIYADGVWILDSGATRHMSGDQDLFSKIERCPVQDYVEVANNERIPITGHGTILLQARKTNRRLDLKDVVYAPKLSKNLFSIRAASQAGCTVQFRQDEAIISYKNKPILYAHLENGLYILDIVKRRGRQEAGLASKLDLKSKYDEHLKMCHFTPDGGVDCSACYEGKSKRTISKVHQEASTTNTLEVMHSDLMELPVPSIGGKNYLLTLIDDYSRYAKVEFLRNKSDTTKALKQMIT